MGEVWTRLREETRPFSFDSRWLAFPFLDREFRPDRKWDFQFPPFSIGSSPRNKCASSWSVSMLLVKPLFCTNSNSEKLLPPSPQLVSTSKLLNTKTFRSLSGMSVDRTRSDLSGDITTRTLRDSSSSSTPPIESESKNHTTSSTKC